ncbi:MAG: DUF1684 domain-containing protein [Saprospiraceae bacterium]
MKHLILFLPILFVACTATNISKKTLNPKEEIIAFQEKLTSDYKNPETSPLREKASEFEGHDFFEINLDYRVQATFEAMPKQTAFTMPTTGPRKPEYRKFGTLKFKLKGQNQELTLYQNIAFINNPIYKDYLFLPFTDLTNGVETYGGGRYIDFRIPKTKTVTLDFNQAYNPYCAYTDGYSCPIVPKENHLETEVQAGILLKAK